MKIYIKGHVSPDLDSIASAYTYAEFLKKLKRYGDAEIIPVRVGEPNKETQLIFDKFNAEMPKHIETYEITEEDRFILVDHNEESQRHETVRPDQVLEIVDHHKMNVIFNSPVRVDVKPVGCTNTIIEELFYMYRLVPSQETRGLMVSSILSDTVGLRSSTTTGYDSEIARRIARDLNIDLDELTVEIFKAKSDIDGLTANDIVRKDFKVFVFGENKVLIAQAETVEPKKLLDMKDELLSVLIEMKVMENVDQAYLVITDILRINSHIIYDTDQERAIVEDAFMTEGDHNIADIGPMMSRKKDIAPAIEEAQQ
jgi:manganese-dependent inorganic pyrophosphatase